MSKSFKIKSCEIGFGNLNFESYELFSELFYAINFELDSISYSKMVQIMNIIYSKAFETYNSNQFSFRFFAPPKSASMLLLVETVIDDN